MDNIPVFDSKLANLKAQWTLQVDCFHSYLKIYAYFLLNKTTVSKQTVLPIDVGCMSLINVPKNLDLLNKLTILCFNPKFIYELGTFEALKN